MKIRQLFQYRRTHLGAVLTTAAAFLLLGSINPAFAKKGGGGKPGGGDPPTEPDPAPFNYRVTWIGDDTEENNRNYFRLYDVTAGGIAVGQFWPANVWNDAYPVIFLPGGDVVDLETLLIAAGKIAPGWRVREATRITDDLLITLPVWDLDGIVHTGALQLNPDGRSVKTFTLFSDPDGESAVPRDLSGDGEILIGASDIGGTPGDAGGYFTGNPATMYVWNPIAGTTVWISGQVQGGGATGWWNSDISDYPAALLEGTFYDYTTDVTFPMPDPGTPVTLRDLSADGTVVALIAGAQIRRNRWEPTQLARWKPGDAQWETLVTGGTNVLVNRTGEIAMTADGELLVFHDGYDLRSVNDLIHPADAGSWNNNATFTLTGISDPLPDDLFGGVILGRESNRGSYFILTPVAE